MGVWRSRAGRVRAGAFALLAGLSLLAGDAGWLAGCAGRSDPWSYRLSNTGENWTTGPDDALLVELRRRYPEYFTVILDPTRTREPDLRPLRRDLERTPADRRNYDALNALAIGYFELNYRAQSRPGGSTYLADSFRAAQLLAMPWRAYGEIRDGRLRNAILAFFEDAGTGPKLGAGSTAPRLAAIVASLEAKEQDPDRRRRIQRLAERLAALSEAQRAGEETPEEVPIYRPLEEQQR